MSTKELTATAELDKTTAPDGAAPRPQTKREKRKAARDALHIARADRFRLRDVLEEAMYGIGARPARLLLTIVGTVLGIGSVVVTVGLAQTAAGQINAQFDAIAATQVVVKPNENSSWGGTKKAISALPWDAAERVSRLAGVEAAGTVGSVDLKGAEVTAVPLNDPSATTTRAVTVAGASTGFLDAVRGSVVTGRFFDDGHDQRGDRVVVLGAKAAERLGINRVDNQPSILIGENSYTVIGIVDGLQRRTDVLDSAIIPMTTARNEFALKAPDEVQIKIAVGAGEVVARQAPIALDPNAPEGFKVQAPPAKSQLRESVQADLNTIFLALGGVALLVGALGIANVTLLSVMERTAEIGLRRAMGATRRNIASQFLIESVVIGLLGGLIGAALGVVVTVVVSIIQGWTPILDLKVAFGAALLGGVIGLVAGTYPALKAAAIEPITALRGGT